MRIWRVLAVACTLAPAPAQVTAESLLETLTLEQKAGQLFMSWILTEKEGQAEARAEMVRLVEEVGIGGIILSLGPVEDAPELVNDLQARARVPLIFASDFEAGIGGRLYGGTRLGCNMLVGATGDAELAREMGRVTAVEGLAVGVHWSFSPVLDVNVNPRNPIINMRSFGEDPKECARLGAAYVEGMQSAGMLACGKHFPGHGDVSVDSHLGMPVLPGDRARLDRVELVPFRAAIAAGVASIMTGHMSVPGLGEDPSVPATLSRQILTGQLRSRDGFDGIIVTDALDMGALEIPPEEAAVRALQAGADLLLMPPDAERARDAVVAAVRAGRVSEARLDRSVLRLLRAKERVGLLAGGGLPDPQWRARIATEEHRELARRIALRGVTLVRRDVDVVPLAPHTRAVLISLEDSTADERRFGSPREFRDAMAELGHELTWHRLRSESPADAVQRAVAEVERADVVIGDVRFRVRSSVVSLRVPPALRPVTTAINEARRSIVVTFGNPYGIEDVPDVSTYLCAYNGGEWTAWAVAAILSGVESAKGVLPVTLPGVAERGESVHRRRITRQAR